MRYQIIKSLFLSSNSIISENLILSDAKKLVSRYNRNSDIYTSYSIEKMPPSIKEIRKLKLDKIDKNKN